MPAMTAVVVDYTFKACF